MRSSQHIAIFMIFIIVMLPIYAADAQALTIQVTKNSGEAGFDGYIDGNGDTWSVEALILDAPQEINPSDVKIDIAGNVASFQSCSDTDLGKTCEYISPLSGGVKEGSHAILVSYQPPTESTPLASDAGAIKIDGSAPKVSNLVAKQVDTKIHLNFNVEEVNDGVGLKKIELINTKTGKIVYEKKLALGTTTYSYESDPQANPFVLEGEGLQHLKVKAYDHFDHVSTSNIASFYADFIKPEIVSDSLEVVAFGKFISSNVEFSDIMVSIKEKSYPIVTATSEQAKINGEAKCVDDELVNDLFHCTWKNVEIFTTGNKISLDVVGRDTAGNEVTKTLSNSFTTDTIAPEIVYFGSTNTYEDKFFVKTGKNQIVLRVKDSGAGITKDQIRANLQGIGGTDNQEPQSCKQNGNELTCIWEETKTFDSDSVARVGLTQLRDKVGNTGELREVELFADITNPVVKKIEILGNEKNFVQSNDHIKILMNIEEQHGLNILVDMNDVVMDAKTKYPATEKNLAGVKIFTQDDCTREKEGVWGCEFTTDPVKSGPDAAKLSIDVQDSAGNSATSWDKDSQNVKSGSKGDYTIDLLGKTDEVNPDYWELAFNSPKSLVKFVDLDTTHLTYTRMPLSVEFTSKKAEMLSLDLIGCTPKGDSFTSVPVTKSSSPTTSPAKSSSPTTSPAIASKIPQISRSIVTGKEFPGGTRSPKTNLILEFAPFDGKEMFGVGVAGENFDTAEVEYSCRFNLLSKVGRVAIGKVEVQEVDVTVAFGFSELGAQDENIEELVQETKDDILFQIPDKIAFLNDIIKVVKLLGPIIAIITATKGIYDAVTAKADIARVVPPGEAGATAVCASNAGASEGMWKIVEYLQVPVQVMSCNPNANSNAFISNTWYGKWQKSVINTFNLYSTAGYSEQTSLYDNIYLSTAGLCIPGIIYNLEKWRQIQCVYIDCLENQVTTGAASVQSCTKTREVLSCKYVHGNGFYLPLSGVMDFVKSTLKTALTNPLGLVNAALTRACAGSCPVSGAAYTACDYVQIGTFVVDIIENVVGVVQQVPAITQDYCSQIGETGTRFLA